MSSEKGFVAVIATNPFPSLSEQLGDASIATSIPKSNPASTGRVLLRRNDTDADPHRSPRRAGRLAHGSRAADRVDGWLGKRIASASTLSHGGLRTAIGVYSVKLGAYDDGEDIQQDNRGNQSAKPPAPNFACSDRWCRCGLEQRAPAVVAGRRIAEDFLRAVRARDDGHGTSLTISLHGLGLLARLATTSPT